MSQEPGLRFWLRYAERQGALVEEAGDQALAVLPARLQETAELPEEVVLTADPDVAREDGAVLVIPGHPALERAAAAVLEEGDVGRVYLPWPRSTPPGRSALEARARDRVQVEHGRIDAAGEPRPAYLPLLRAGATVGYSASLALRFREQEEAWVDARTGLGVSEQAFGALEGRPRLPEPDAAHPVLEADLALALTGAHAQLEERARARRESLRAQARRALESELASADAYYAGALESIEQRRSSAAPERLPLLDAQAEATRAEHARRRREIEDEFEARHEIRPFRLHLVHVPAFVLPVEVRRGTRTFPFALAWLAAAGVFADVRCPGCGASAALVAGRERLGCNSCLPRAAEPAGDVGRAGPASDRHRKRRLGGAASRPAHLRIAERRSDASEAVRETPSPSSPGEHPAQAAAPAAPTSGQTALPTGVKRNPARRARRRSGSERRSTSPAGPGIARIGNKLALGFWQAVALGDRWPRKKVVSGSPLTALYRLYGAAGPLCALGIPPQNWPSEVTAGTLPHTADSPQLTTGSVVASGTSYAYALYWQLEAGKPVVCEVMPAPHPAVLSSPASGYEAAARLLDEAPSPSIELDPVAAALWRTELADAGLPLAVRCLATWWRLQDALDPDHPPAAIAAALSGAVARAAGKRRTRAQAAATYATSAEALDRVARELGAGLRLYRRRGW